jgi:hypothetical protein
MSAMTRPNVRNARDAGLQRIVRGEFENLHRNAGRIHQQRRRALSEIDEHLETFSRRDAQERQFDRLSEETSVIADHIHRPTVAHVKRIDAGVGTVQQPQTHDPARHDRHAVELAVDQNALAMEAVENVRLRYYSVISRAQIDLPASVPLELWSPPSQ